MFHLSLKGSSGEVSVVVVAPDPYRGSNMAQVGKEVPVHAVQSFVFQTTIALCAAAPSEAARKAERYILVIEAGDGNIGIGLLNPKLDDRDKGADAPIAVKQAGVDAQRIVPAFDTKNVMGALAVFPALGDAQGRDDAALESICRAEGQGCAMPALLRPVGIGLFDKTTEREAQLW